jgi:hypothetical protein
LKQLTTGQSYASSNTSFTGSVTATGFKSSTNVSSNNFLKSNGTVDTTTYNKLVNISSTGLNNPVSISGALNVGGDLTGTGLLDGGSY